jgi:hypothetical protein
MLYTSDLRYHDIPYGEHEDGLKNSYFGILPTKKMYHNEGSAPSFVRCMPLAQGFQVLEKLDRHRPVKH